MRRVLQSAGQVVLCAWILWSHTMGASLQTAEPVAGYPTAEICYVRLEEYQAVFLDMFKGTPEGSELQRRSHFKCFPENFDPRKASTNSTAP